MRSFACGHEAAGIHGRIQYQDMLVEGLLTSNDGGSVRDLAAAFIRLGYAIRVEKINFAGYGVPQTRKRVLIVGNNVGIDFSMPLYTHTYNSGKAKSKILGLPFAPTVSEALAGLSMPSKDTGSLVGYRAKNPQSQYDELMRADNEGGRTSLHYACIDTDDARKYALLKPGQSMRDLPETHWHESFVRRANRRVSDGTPSEKRGGAPHGIKRLVPYLNAWTITGAANCEFIHFSEDRPITLREAARLQSFPDKYAFAGASIAQQIGNAVPPLVASRLARHIANLDDNAPRNSARNESRLLGFQLTDALGMSDALSMTHQKLTDLLMGRKIDVSRQLELMEA